MGNQPDFRKRHLEALPRLFAQTLKLCHEAGLLKLGHASLVSTKVKAHASKHDLIKLHRRLEGRESMDQSIAPR